MNSVLAEVMVTLKINPQLIANSNFQYSEHSDNMITNVITNNNFIHFKH
jgi:hypothetical protein